MKLIENEHGKPVWVDVELDSDFDRSMFYDVKMSSHEDSQIALHSNFGSITVLTRMTGYGFMDTETGFLDKDRKFWLASGDMDVTESGVTNFGDAIDWIKSRANTCIGG